jgi:hypothetical protein
VHAGDPQERPLAGPVRPDHGLPLLVRRAIEAHLGSRDVARVIYGSIIGLALVVALDAHPPSAAEMVSILLGTAIAVGLAEVYSEFVGTEARTRHHVTREELRTLLADAGAVLFGAGFPAVFFALAAAGAVDLDTAFDLAKWTGLGLICAYAFAAARLAGSSRWQALVHAAVLGAIGGALIALKALVH